MNTPVTTKREPVLKCLRDIALIIVGTVVAVEVPAMIGARILEKSGPGTLILVALCLTATLLIIGWVKGWK